MSVVSPREAEVLELLGEGLTNAQISRRLFISVRTVESHVSSMLRKLELPDRRALAASDATGGLEREFRGTPEPLTSFVGRSRDLREITDVLGRDRLVTLTGPGGVGKTRLAIEAAHRHSAAAKWFVDLVPAEADEVVLTIATAMGVGEHPNQSLEQVVQGALAERPALVVLDNCEHLLDGVGQVAARLLRACPDLVLLATSREAIGVPGERVVQVPPLAVDDSENGAVALFLARATAAGVPLDEMDRSVIAEICTRLDGMPLSIELAAARVATLGPDGLLTALGDTLRALSGARGADERHRSLRAVLDWSYELLEEEERTVLSRASVFHGSFRLADIAGVVNDVLAATATADVVGRLAAKSLVVHRRGAGSDSTFRLLETLRAYGHEKLEANGDLEEARDRHCEWAGAIAADLERDLEATDVADHRVDDVFDDLRAGLSWAAARGRSADAHELARRIAHLAYARRFTSMARQRYEEAAGYAATEAEAADDLVDAGYVALAVLRADTAYDHFLEAARRAEAGGVPSKAALALALAAECASRFSGAFGTMPPRAHVDGHLARARELGADAEPPLAARISLAAAWLSTPSLASATEPAAQAALTAAQAAGDAASESSALDAVGAAAWEGGRLGESARVASDRVSLLDRLAVHDPRTGAEQRDILHMATTAQLQRGDLPTALVLARGAIDHPLAVGALPLLRHGLVVGLCLTGWFDEAVVEAEQMRAEWKRDAEPAAGWMVPATSLTALVHGLRGDRDECERWVAVDAKAACTTRPEIRTFADLRLALHENRVPDAVASLDRHLATAEPGSAEEPWRAPACGYGGYLWSIAAEIWALMGLPDTEERIEVIRETYGEHLWASPCLDRATGRLRGDESFLREAATGFAKIDARFEEASTLALLDGPEGSQGRAMLRALGCDAPAR